jgi:glucose/arabinose dehydrogenase
MNLRLCFLFCFSLIVIACAPATAPRVTVLPPVAPTDTAPPQQTLPVLLPTLTPVPTTTPAPVTPKSSSSTVGLQPVASNLTRPVYLTHAGDERLFVVEQAGRIRIIAQGQLLDGPFLDLTDHVLSSGNEQGLLSVAFPPDYAATGRFFVDYTRKGDGATIVERYQVSKSDPNVADKSSAGEVIVIKQPEANHNGGLIKFGPDGFLYIGMGDGGGQGDQHGSIGNGQNPKALLGKLLRIDVTNQTTYTIPASNPLGNEIWALGLRNPWRYSFDRLTGDLYIADVGQDTYEEVDFQPAASAGGENYGWRIMEGLHCYNPSAGCDRSGLTLPIAEYSHGEGCSVTGGYVYRGANYPALQGQYFFADYCSGTIWSLQRDAAGQWTRTERLAANLPISSFGEDVHGELYVIDLGGAVYQLVAK